MKRIRFLFLLAPLLLDGFHLSAADLPVIQTGWVERAAVPSAEHVNGVRGIGTAAVNNRLYLVGGLKWPNAIATLLEYDPTADRWTKKRNMLTARYGPAAATVGGKIYAIGGAVNDTTLNTVEEYDPISDSWSPKASMSDSRFSFKAVVVDEKIYVFGGHSVVVGGNPDWTSVEEFDPALNVWRKRASMPTPRTAYGAAAVNGKIYLIGGVVPRVRRGQHSCVARLRIRPSER